MILFSFWCVNLDLFLCFRCTHTQFKVQAHDKLAEGEELFKPFEQVKTSVHKRLLDTKYSYFFPFFVDRKFCLMCLMFFVL